MARDEKCVPLGWALCIPSGVMLGRDLLCCASVDWKLKSGLYQIFKSVIYTVPPHPCCPRCKLGALVWMLWARLKLAPKLSQGKQQVSMAPCLSPRTNGCPREGSAGLQWERMKRVDRVGMEQGRKEWLQLYLALSHLPTSSGTGPQLTPRLDRGSPPLAVALGSRTLLARPGEQGVTWGLCSELQARDPGESGQGRTWPVAHHRPLRPSLRPSDICCQG